MEGENLTTSAIWNVHVIAVADHLGSTRKAGSVFRGRCTRLVLPSATGEMAGVARERRLGAREVEEIFSAFAEAMRELPPDVEAGWLDAQGDLRLAPDIARKLRTARRVRQLLQELRQREREG